MQGEKYNANDTNEEANDANDANMKER